jgi:hypothetical protein
MNRRSDAYGGSLENRMRFGLQMLEAIRRVVGDDYIVGIRMPGDEMLAGGLTQEDCLRRISALSRRRRLGQPQHPRCHLGCPADLQRPLAVGGSAEAFPLTKTFPIVKPQQLARRRTIYMLLPSASSLKGRMP